MQVQAPIAAAAGAGAGAGHQRSVLDKYHSQRFRYLDHKFSSKYSFAGSNTHKRICNVRAQIIATGEKVKARTVTIYWRGHDCPTAARAAAHPVMGPAVINVLAAPAK